MKEQTRVRYKYVDALRAVRGLAVWLLDFHNDPTERQELASMAKQAYALAEKHAGIAKKKEGKS